MTSNHVPPDGAPDDDAGQRARARAVAATAVTVAARLGVTLPPGLRLWGLVGEVPVPQVPAEAVVGTVTPRIDLAEVLERSTPAGQRRVNGLHVTPAWIADRVVELALADLPDTTPWAVAGSGRRGGPGAAGRLGGLAVCDPACGGGAFLLAVASALRQRGVDARHVVQHLVWGADIDPVGLAAAEAALTLWSGGEPPPPGHLVVGDALTQGGDLWPDPPPSGFDVVVGNPPFLNQLGRVTVRTRGEVARLRRRFGPAVQAYTDTAWLFLLLGVELARVGGRVAMLQPWSVVGARDSAAVRASVDRCARLRDLWLGPQRTFAAAVQVCAPVLDVVGRRDLGSHDPGTAAQAGAGGARAPGLDPGTVPGSNDWASRLADALGVPRVAMSGTSRLGDAAAVTAGFRDEYYGLVPLVREARDDELLEVHDGDDVEDSEDSEDGSAAAVHPLLTVGILDWGRSRWGERPARFAKRRWARPVVDVSGVDPADRSPAARGAARWIERVRVPKVLVATQTRVVEAAVDPAGRWIPSVPALVVLPARPTDRGADPEDLWLLAAAISAPSSTAWLLRRAPGTALSRAALKIAARDLAHLPLPRDAGAWAEAAELLRGYSRAPAAEPFEAYVAAAAAAYGADDDLVAWWRSRLPPTLPPR